MQKTAGGINITENEELIYQFLYRWLAREGHFLTGVILQSVTVIKSSLVYILCLNNERQTGRAGERPKVIDIQWKRSVRKPKPCSHGAHNKTLETCRSVMKQTVMSTAVCSTVVWPSTSWKQQTVYQTFPAVAMLPYLHCLLRHYTEPDEVNAIHFWWEDSSCDRSCYESKGHSEMGHSLDETLPSRLVDFTCPSFQFVKE